MRAPGIALYRIPSPSAFVVFSESAGLISGHETAGDAIKALTEYLKKQKTHPKYPKEVEPPTILKRKPDGWHVY